MMLGVNNLGLKIPKNIVEEMDSKEQATDTDSKNTWQTRIRKLFPYARENALFHKDPKAFFANEYQYVSNIANEMLGKFSNVVALAKNLGVSSNTINNIIIKAEKSINPNAVGIDALLLMKQAISICLIELDKMANSKENSNLSTKLSYLNRMINLENNNYVEQKANLDFFEKIYLDNQEQYHTNALASLFNTHHQMINTQHAFNVEKLTVEQNDEKEVIAKRKNDATSFKHALLELMDYMKHVGIRHPLIVRPEQNSSMDIEALSEMDELIANWNTQLQIRDDHTKERYLIVADFLESLTDIPDYAVPSTLLSKLIKTDNINDPESFDKNISSTLRKLTAYRNQISQSINSHKELIASIKQCKNKICQAGKNRDTANTEYEAIFTNNQQYKEVFQLNKQLEKNAKSTLQTRNIELSTLQLNLESDTKDLENIENNLCTVLNTDKDKLNAVLSNKDELASLFSNIDKAHKSVITNIFKLRHKLINLENKSSANKIEMLYSRTSMAKNLQRLEPLNADIKVRFKNLEAAVEKQSKWLITYKAENVDNLSAETLKVIDAHMEKLVKTTDFLAEIKYTLNSSIPENVSSLNTEFGFNIDDVVDFNKRVNKSLQNLSMLNVKLQKYEDDFTEVEFFVASLSVDNRNFFKEEKKYEIQNESGKIFNFLVNYEKLKHTTDTEKMAIHKAMDKRTTFAKAKGEDGVKYENMGNNHLSYYELKFPKGLYGNWRGKFEKGTCANEYRLDHIVRNGHS